MGHPPASAVDQRPLASFGPSRVVDGHFTNSAIIGFGHSFADWSATGTLPSVATTAEPTVLAFSEVRLSSLVTVSPQARTHVENAEGHMGAGQCDDAIVEIACAFHRLLKESEERMARFSMMGTLSPGIYGGDDFRR